MSMGLIPANLSCYIERLEFIVRSFSKLLLFYVPFSCAAFCPQIRETVLCINAYFNGISLDSFRLGYNEKKSCYTHQKRDAMEIYFDLFSFLNLTR